MTEPYDIAAQIRAKVAEAIRECAPAETYGYSLTMGVMSAPNGQDTVIWVLLLTCRSPLLGHPDLGATAKFPGNTVSDAEIARAVNGLVAALREQFATVLREGMSGGNGHLPAAFGGKPS
jgi:hypothetical protein